MDKDSTMLDAIGQRHPVYRPEDARIVSLVPSITELLCELGLAPSLVGRTGFCIHPANAVRLVPKIGGTKDVNIEKIRKLAPTHVIVNIDENEKPTVDLLAAFVPHIIVTHPQTPADNVGLYQLLGTLFSVNERARQLQDQFTRALAALPAKRVNERVLYCVWKDPWMTVAPDTYIANMLALTGITTWSPANNGARYPVFAWDAKMLDEIDRVFLSTEPYRFTDAHVDALEQQIGKPVQLVDGEMISWYGSRAIAGLRYLHSLYD